MLVIFFGAKRIPDIAQSLGKGIKEFKKAVKDVPEDSEKKDVGKEELNGSDLRA